MIHPTVFIRLALVCQGANAIVAPSENRSAVDRAIGLSGAGEKASMSKQTPLYQAHLDAGAKMVDFAGWSMPIHYGSQLDEHKAVRQSVGVFDVSHMRAVAVIGEDAEAYLRRLLANDVAKLEDGRALYTCMLDEQAGILDDLIVYRLGPKRFRMVVNAGTADKDLAWMQRQASGDLTVEARPDLAILALQGPQAAQHLASIVGAAAAGEARALKPFRCHEDNELFIGRTGYTGEDGFEVMLPHKEAITGWKALMHASVQPCGLGARDTLRLEAGMCLYGQDMDESVTPLQSGLGWTVAWEPADRDFIGREALKRQQDEGIPDKLVGVVLEGRGVLRPHQKLIDGDGREGELTSGSFAPTLNGSIGLARVPRDFADTAEVDIRGRRLPVRFVHPPFVRKGKVLV